MPTPAELARRAAIQLLSRQPYTARRLRDKLRRRGFDPGTIADTLDELTVSGAVDDAAYAREFVSYHAGDRGARRLAADLRGRGVERQHIEAALATLEDQDEGETAEALLRRMKARYEGLEPSVARRRAYAALARRGFSYDAARRALERVLGEDEVD